MTTRVTTIAHAKDDGSSTPLATHVYGYDDGASLHHAAYDGFGSITSETGTGGDRFKYTGREFDPETGLYYYRARMYDPESGRFTEQDPIGFAAGDANLYRYVGNGPTNATDPMGLNEVQKLPHQQEYWNGAVMYGEANGLPTFLLEWARDSGLVEIYSTTGRTHYESHPLYNNIYMAGGPVLTVPPKIGQHGEYDPSIHPGLAMEILYNEVWHAYYDLVIEHQDSAYWIIDVMERQKQYGWRRKWKATEEAMSNIINQAIIERSEGGTIPSYEEIINGNDKEWKDAITPGHNDPGEIWEHWPGSRLPVTEDLYKMTIYILLYEPPSDRVRPLVPPPPPGIDTGPPPIPVGYHDGLMPITPW